MVCVIKSLHEHTMLIIATAPDALFLSLLVGFVASFSHHNLAFGSAVTFVAHRQEAQGRSAVKFSGLRINFYTIFFSGLTFLSCRCFTRIRWYYRLSVPDLHFFILESCNLSVIGLSLSCLSVKAKVEKN